MKKNLFLKILSKHAEISKIQNYFLYLLTYISHISQQVFSVQRKLSEKPQI